MHQIWYFYHKMNNRLAIPIYYLENILQIKIVSTLKRPASEILKTNSLFKTVVNNLGDTAHQQAI